MRAAAVAGHYDVLADAARACRAALERLDAELAERMHEAEARRLVIGERKAAGDHSLVGGEPDRARLGDEIADRENQSVLAADDTAAGALGAEDLRGEG